MTITRRLAFLHVVALILCGVVPSLARADDPGAAARAYAQAQSAEVGGQQAQAAELYQTAYRFAPHPVSLRAAIRTHLAAGHKAAAATLSERLLSRHPDDAKSVEYARQVLDQTRAEVARLSVTCEVECLVLIDGQAATLEGGTDHVVFVLPGTRNLSVRYVAAGVESEAQSVDAVAGSEASASFAAPVLPPEPVEPEPVQQTPAPAAPAEPKSRGIRPVYTLVTAGVALALGGVATWSGLDVLKAHDAYDRKDPNAAARYNEGKKLEKRTNALIGAAAGVAVVAGVLAIFTDWRGEDKPSASTALGAGPGLVGLSVDHRF